MFRFDENERLNSDNVVDILRGSIQFDTLAGILRCLKAIDKDPAFRIRRIKDRFTPGQETAAHWRDLMLNGSFTARGVSHIVEIQLHHDTLVIVREKMGGHYIYARVRSLLEAMEVVFGPVETARKIEARRWELESQQQRPTSPRSESESNPSTPGASTIPPPQHGGGSALGSAGVVAAASSAGGPVLPTAAAATTSHHHHSSTTSADSPPIMLIRIQRDIKNLAGFKIAPSSLEITEISPHCTAYADGVRTGCKVVQVNGNSISTWDQYTSAA